MINPSDYLRGHTETIILKYLLHQDNYGYQINKAIRDTSDNTYSLKEATLYSAFKRMEEKGYITSYWSHVDNKPRKYYHITDLGRNYYDTSVKDYLKLKELLDNLILEKD